MDLDLFLMSLALTLGVVGAALLYMRGITRQVLLELCHTDVGAAFWLRSADVLALSGSLILVLAFGGTLRSASPVDQLRLVLGLALAGLFITVVLVASSVWRNVKAPAASSEVASAEAM